MRRKLFLSIIVLILGLGAYSQHTVVLVSGEKIEGVVMEIRHDTLFFAVQLQMTEIPLKKVSSIFLKEYVAYDGELIANGEPQTIWSGDYLIKYVIKDRKMITPPKISIGTEDKGTVVVQVVVDRYGNVLECHPGYTGSTTSNKYLFTKAKFAAQGAKFNSHMTGPVRTNALIIITY
ncbi:hypothetical protein ACFLQ5_00585 [Bacteroidota bacterium]